MSAYDTLRSAMDATKMDQVIVMRLDLAELLAEVDQLRAAATAKKPRAKKAAIITEKCEAMPAWLPKEAWAAFLAMRVKIKKPATEYAQKLLLKKLAAFYVNDQDPEAILNQSIMNGWQDLYELKVQQGRGQGNRNTMTTMQQAAANSAEALRLLGQPMFDPNDGQTIEAMP